MVRRIGRIYRGSVEAEKRVAEEELLESRFPKVITEEAVVGTLRNLMKAGAIKAGTTAVTYAKDEIGLNIQSRRRHVYNNVTSQTEGGEEHTITRTYSPFYKSVDDKNSLSIYVVAWLTVISHSAWGRELPVRFEDGVDQKDLLREAEDGIRATDFLVFFNSADGVYITSVIVSSKDQRNLALVRVYLDNGEMVVGSL